MTTPTLIALAYASDAPGHRMAAEAVAREIATLAGDRVTTEMLDVLDDVSGSVVRLSTGSLAYSPAGRLALSLLSPAFGVVGRRFTARLDDLGPAAVVCTHPLAAVLAVRHSREAHVRRHVITAPSGFGLPGLSPRSGVALQCVADDAAATELVHRGVPVSSIATTGVPVRPQFTVEYDTSAARAHFGLPAETRLILAIAGSPDAPLPSEFTESLSVSLPALAGIPGTTLAVVTGRDTDLAKRLRSRTSGFTITNVHIFDYVEYMAPLVSCADLVLSRPTGLICAECVDSGAPMILVGPVAPDERANVRALLAADAAILAEDPRALAENTRRAMSDPARLDAMRQGARSLARPFAATDIARRVLEFVGLSGDEPAAASVRGA